MTITAVGTNQWEAASVADSVGLTRLSIHQEGQVFAHLSKLKSSQVVSKQRKLSSYVYATSSLNTEMSTSTEVSYFSKETRDCSTRNCE